MQQNQKVYLVFPSLSALWAFAQTIGIRSLEIVPSTCTLICELRSADIERAQEEYGAEVKNPDSISTSQKNKD